MKTLFRLFSKGLMVALPFVLLVWIISFLFSILVWIWKHVFSLVASISNLAFSHSDMNTISIPVSIGILISIFLVIIYIGFRVEKEQKAFFIAITERVLAKIPMLNSIYQTIKDMISMISGDSQDKYLGVTYIDLGGGEMIGFITNHDGDYYLVFVPFSPPTSGLLFRVHKDKIKRLDISVSDALKKVVSFGMK